ncbi:hypothetical protein G6F37_008984 [Rhizopus arrhizus]|nr:hypothetical protein G6F38_009017 [Rhizopus arrhizus]KAG1154953.1 hypothetical protein G6F37_008984 [Rhizopus arrhizus]
MLNEVCKTPGSNTAFLHFASAESASVFYNHYVDKGVTINGIPFTVYPAKVSDGEYVTYDDKDLNFGGVVNASVVPLFTDTTATTVPVSTDTTATAVPISTDISEWN